MTASPDMAQTTEMYLQASIPEDTALWACLKVT